MVPEPTIAKKENNSEVAPRLYIFNKKGQKYPKIESEKMDKLLEDNYKAVKKEYDNLVEEELATDYMLAVGDDEDDDENVFRKNLISKNFTPPPMTFEDVPASQVTSLSKVFPKIEESGKKALTQVSCSFLKTGPARRPMNYWIPMEQSIPTKEWKPTVHVSNPSYINDWILYKLMRKVLDGPFDGIPDLFYYGIYKKWPNKWTQSQLSSDFPLLCEQFAEDGYDVEAAEPWETEQVATENSENVKCYACLGYMCAVHGFSKKLPTQFPGGDFIEVKVPLPNSDEKDYCSEECWKMVELEEAAEVLDATDEEKQCFTVTAFINKHRAVREQAEEGLLAAAYGADSNTPFCEFVNIFVDPEVDDLRIRTCRAAYEFILKTVERPSETRLAFNKPSKQLDFKTRTKNFRIHQNKLALKRTRDAEIVGGSKKTENAFNMVAPLVGCRHSGPCGMDENKCVCAKNGVCSHLCHCDVNCKLRFPGCICAPGQCKTKSCPCFHSKFSCNPLTCKSCNCEGSHGVGGVCSNSGMQRFTSKRLCTGPSKIAGNGLFLVDSAEKHEFIVEYTGERLTNEEAEHRGAIYDKMKSSYLFNLTTGGAIDAYKVGNLSRFANHDDKTPTCYIRQIIVGGEERIGFFANRDLVPGTELTFDYCYSQDHKDYFKGPEPKRSKK